LIAGIDSSGDKPTPATVAAAIAGGVRMWSGYLASRAGVGLAAPWSAEDFALARQCGAKPIAYCSGYDDPAALKALAGALDVRLCLDVERGIRGDGPWVQAWLDASGAGLYGNAPVHPARRAAFYILAAYPGFDPKATWSATGRPPGPCGWQWQGTHSEFGIAVDRGWFDDWFMEDEEMNLSLARKRFHAWQMIMLCWGRNPTSEEELNEVAEVIQDNGENLYDVQVAVYNNPNGVAYRAKQAAAGQGGAVPPHSHTGTVSVR
jgi:hypothetical protein